jgi:hypothetical protein
MKKEWIEPEILIMAVTTGLNANATENTMGTIS